MPKITRKWELFPGRSKFCCDGRLMMAPNTGIFYVTVCLIIGTCGLFFVFDCPFLAIRVSPVIPVISGLLFLFTMSALLRTSFSDPGIIPRATHDEAALFDKQIEVPNSSNSPTYRPPPRTKEILVKGQPVKLKYCFTCKIFRPPRASHCSLCDNCVDRFDHHCPWVGNCVGRRNYRYFYMFIMSLAFLCVFIFACVITHLIMITREDKPFIDAVKDSPASIVIAVVCFFSVWSVLGLAGFHTYLASSNQTTNEDIKGSFSSKRGQEGFNPYSEGNVCMNCFHVLCGPVPPSLLDRRGVVTEEMAAELTRQNQPSATRPQYGAVKTQPVNGGGVFPSLNDTCGTPNPLQQQCKTGNYYNQKNSALLAQQTNSANGELHKHSNITNGMADLKIMNMIKPEMIQSRSNNKFSNVIVPEPGKKKSLTNQVGSIEDLNANAVDSKSNNKCEISPYERPEPPNIIRFQKFYPTFATSVQDFRGLQMFPPAEYAFSNFQPRTTEKGILEPSPVYESTQYDSNRPECNNPCLEGKGTHDYIPRNHVVRSFGQNYCTERSSIDRSSNKLGAYTVPRKNNQIRKPKNVPPNYFNHQMNIKQPCDNKSPFKIAQSEHFSLLNSQQMNYDNAKHFTNHPFGAFHLVQTLPRAYISESQAVPRKEPAYVQPFSDISNRLYKLDTRPFNKQLYRSTPYNTVVLPFEVNSSTKRNPQKVFFEKEKNSGPPKAGIENLKLSKKESASDICKKGKNSEFYKLSDIGDQNHGMSKRTAANVLVGDKYAPSLGMSVRQSNMTDDRV